MSIFREFNINMVPGKPPLIIHVSQYESDFVYTFNLVSGKSVLAIPDTAIAVIRGTKRDGNGYSVEAALDAENHKVVVMGDPQLTACAGRNVFELAIINDEKVICTANFFLDVEHAPLDSDTIRSETVLHDLQAIINSAATATQAAEEASASAESAASAAEQAVEEKFEDGVAETIDEWLTEHPEATTTVQDGAITKAKLSSALKCLTVNLNGLTYVGNIPLPVATSYVEAVTYLNGYYYAVCLNYSANTCYVAVYDTDFALVNNVSLNGAYGNANNIFNDGERIYIDFDSGFHVSFNTSISDDFAVQNSDIRNMAYWNDTLYGIKINSNNVTVYTVASDFTTITEIFTVATVRQTLQSASIIEGILIIPTTKGLFKFIDMETQSMIVEVPYYDSKEIENFFLGADGNIKCCGHFYGLNGIFNIGTFDGGVDGAKMQYTNVDGNNGDHSTLSRSSQRYGFYKITNGTAMGLPVNVGDLLVFEEARLFVSKTNNVLYAYSNNAWNLIGFLSKKRISVKADGTNYVHFELNTDGHFTMRCDILTITAVTTQITVDLSEIYTALGLASGKTFNKYIIGTTNTENIGATGNEVYAAQVYITMTKVYIYTRNITQNSTTNINAKFSFYEKII